jgi:TPR repeat protein
MYIFLECWNDDPDNRPSIEEVTSRLKEMLNKIDEQTDDDNVQNVRSLSNLSNNLTSKVSSEKAFDHVPSGELRKALAIEIDHNDDHNDEQRMVDNIVDFIWRKTNEGKESKLKDYVAKSIGNKLQRIFNWLSSNNQNNLNCNFLLGYFHYKGIGTGEDKTKAFQLFLNAEKQDHDLTVYYLGICYQYGYGTMKDEKSAFNCFFKLSQKDIAAGQLRTGHFYAKGIGVKNDKKLAADCYEKASNNGNLSAKYNLGNCYLIGKLVDKDVKKGFELIQQTAESEFSLNGITMLGFCYHNGIGTKEDKDEAFKLYKKAANLGDKIAQYNLAQMYEKEDHIMKDIDNAIRWYKKSGYKDSEKRAKKLLKIKLQDLLNT